MTGIAAQASPQSAASDAATVVVAAQDPLARIRLVRALAGRPNLCVGSGGSTRELIAGAPSADLLVNYCQSFGAAELELFKELGRDRSELLIVAVCESADGRAARRAVDTRIDGLVWASGLEAALAPTVTAVLAGQMVVPRELHAAVRKPSLSVRERQILRMVVMGFTNSEISARMYLAESTVKSHLSSAYTKLGARSRSEAVDLILDPRGSVGTGILAITSYAQPGKA